MTNQSDHSRHRRKPRVFHCIKSRGQDPYSRRKNHPKTVNLNNRRCHFRVIGPKATMLEKRVNDGLPKNKKPRSARKGHKERELERVKTCVTHALTVPTRPKGRQGWKSCRP